MIPRPSLISHNTQCTCFLLCTGELGRQQCSSSGHWGHMTGILDHQNVVWLGDLNYRLTCSDEEARK